MMQGPCSLKKISSILLFLFFLNSSFCLASDKIVVGYYPAWQRSVLPADQIKYEWLTHINHSFVWPNEDGSLSTYHDFFYPELIIHAHQAGVKVNVTVGGWGNSDSFSPVVSDSTTRSLFIQNMIDFCIDYHYDGIDVNWEHPSTSEDRQNLNLFISTKSCAVNVLSGWCFHSSRQASFCASWLFR